MGSVKNNISISEVRTGYVDDDNYRYIDVWFDDNPDSEGKTVALVCRDTLKVVYVDNAYRLNDKVRNAIASVLKDEKRWFDNDWRFVEKYYPNYDHCQAIADAQDIEKIVDMECEEGDSSHNMLMRDYDGNYEHPQIIIDYELIHYDIYKRAIDGFLAQALDT